MRSELCVHVICVFHDWIPPTRSDLEQAARRCSIGDQDAKGAEQTWGQQLDVEVAAQEEEGGCDEEANARNNWKPPVFAQRAQSLS
jgi:hypothetical protein